MSLENRLEKLEKKVGLIDGHPRIVVFIDGQPDPEILPGEEVMEIRIEFVKPLPPPPLAG